MSDNGQPQGQARTQLEDELADADSSNPGALPTVPKLRLEPDTLTPGDFKRARKLLGVDPYEAITADDREDRIIFMIWCIKSRTDPGFTMAQAEQTPFGQFDITAGGEPPPPPAAQPGSPGPAAATPRRASSKRKRPAGASASS
jgi:hypothetical protein